MNANQAFQRALAASQKYTEETVIGLGALKGTPCTIKQIEEVKDTDGNVIANKITFEWTATDGTVETDTITVKNGTGEDGIVIELEQATVSTIWALQHDLDTPWYNLSITCLSTENDVVIGDVDVATSTDNLLVIKFKEPLKGKVIIKK